MCEAFLKQRNGLFELNPLLFEYTSLNLLNLSVAQPTSSHSSSLGTTARQASRKANAAAEAAACASFLATHGGKGRAGGQTARRN
ncbi:unnamed protein product [Caenorhabditis auriculariae]|uniref:Uncharacterized protein n=1 Tax=Caenorhabditis auriculariae TaxID=2777116 RepID=A0A8S1GQV0_9PELO|nr:unnamed protein product [Caenorhabditis auriculariae]